MNYDSLLVPIVKGTMESLPLRSSLLAWSAFDLGQEYSGTGMQHYQWASETVEQVKHNFLSEAPTPVKIGVHHVNTLEVIILTTLFLFRCDAQLQNYKSLVVRSSMFCSWILPRLEAIPKYPIAVMLSGPFVDFVSVHEDIFSYAAMIAVSSFLSSKPSRFISVIQQGKDVSGIGN